MIDKRRKINDILIRFIADDWYSRDAATTDILKLIETSHFVHKCQDEISELKSENKRLVKMLKQARSGKKKGQKRK